MRSLFNPQYLVNPTVGVRMTQSLMNTFVIVSYPPPQKKKCKRIEYITNNKILFRDSQIKFDYFELEYDKDRFKKLIFTLIYGLHGMAL